MQEYRQWPPQPFDRAFRDMETWVAWYAGDTEQLADIYSGYRMHRQYERQRYNNNRDTFFWGRSNTNTNVKRRHVPVASNVARASADLLFSKPPIVLPSQDDEDNEALQERITHIFGGDQWASELLEAAENASILGGVYLRPWWDATVADHVVPTHVAADTAIPVFVHNRLKEVTFWKQVSTDVQSPVIRHLEHHQIGKITHTLWAGTENSLGEKISLEDHHTTQWLTSIVNKKGEIRTGLDVLDVVYVPNVRPNRIWRRIPGLQHMGRSDLEGIESELDALDEAYTSWMRDVELGKARIFVSEDLLRDMGAGEGAQFEIDQEIYTKLASSLGSLDAGGPSIETTQFNIRWQEHSQTCGEIINNILRAVGLSSSQFTDGNVSVGVTATEINSRNAITENTRKKKLAYWRPALAEFAKIILMLDSVVFKTGVSLNSAPLIQFPAQLTQSEQELTSVVTQQRQANLLSREQAIRKLNPDWSDDEINAEIERIIQDMQVDAAIQYGQGMSDAAGDDTDIMSDWDAEDEGQYYDDEYEDYDEDYGEDDNTTDYGDDMDETGQDDQDSSGGY